MSLQSQLTRLARNVGALTADTNAIFEALRAKGVNVPANAQLSDVADMIESIVPPHQNEVEIGGIEYPIAKIGNKYWLLENLDFKAIGINIAPPLNNSSYDTPGAWYYNNNEQTYGQNGNKFGLLYNYKCIEFFLTNENILNGFKIPSKSDVEGLCNELQNIEIGHKLKSEEFWNGLNLFGFNAKPAGECTGGTFKNLNNYFICWLKDYDTVNNRRSTFYFDAGDNIYYGAGGIRGAWSIRLCKDA